MPGSAFCGNCGLPTDSPPAPDSQVYDQFPPSQPGSFYSQYSASQYSTTQPSAPTFAAAPAPGPSQVNPLVGAASPNQSYLGNRLVYGEKHTDFDPLTNPVFLRALFSRAFAVAAVWSFGFVVLFVIFFFIGISYLTTPTTYLGYASASSSSSNPFEIWFVLLLLWSIFLGCLFWFGKIPAQLSEWMLTVDGKGAVALAALDHMYTIIKARRPPITNLRVVQFTTPAQPPRDYLEITGGSYQGFVSCFAYGADLFIGWTFWLHLSPAKWLGLTLRRMLQGSPVYGSLAFDAAKAMREMIHSAVRQGVDVAAGDVGPVGQGTIGQMVPIIAVSSK